MVSRWPQALDIADSYYGCATAQSGLYSPFPQGCTSVVQDGLKVAIFLPQTPEGRSYVWFPPSLTQVL